MWILLPYPLTFFFKLNMSLVFSLQFLLKNLGLLFCGVSHTLRISLNKQFQMGLWWVEKWWYANMNGVSFHFTKKYWFYFVLDFSCVPESNRIQDSIKRCLSIHGYTRTLTLLIFCTLSPITFPVSHSLSLRCKEDHVSIYSFCTNCLGVVGAGGSWL